MGRINLDDFISKVAALFADETTALRQQLEAAGGVIKMSANDYSEDCWLCMGGGGRVEAAAAWLAENEVKE